MSTNAQSSMSNQFFNAFEKNSSVSGKKFKHIKLQFIMENSFIYLVMPNQSKDSNFSISHWETVESNIHGMEKMYALTLHMSNSSTKIYFNDESRRRSFTFSVLLNKIYNMARKKSNNLNYSTFNNKIKKFNNAHNNKLIKGNGNTPTIDNNALHQFFNFSIQGGKGTKYIKLEGGGKRLIRYGPKGGKYYMKGGKKVYIK